jgi:hypothetical protein
MFGHQCRYRHHSSYYRKLHHHLSFSSYPLMWSSSPTRLHRSEEQVRSRPTPVWQLGCPLCNLDTLTAGTSSRRFHHGEMDVVCGGAQPWGQVRRRLEVERLNHDETYSQIDDSAEAHEQSRWGEELSLKLEEHVGYRKSVGQHTRVVVGRMGLQRCCPEAWWHTGRRLLHDQGPAKMLCELVHC